MAELILAFFAALVALPLALGWLGCAGLVAFIILLLLFDGWESPGIAGLFIVAAAGALWYLGIFNLALWVLHNPGWSAIYFFGWFAIGALWAAKKFDRYGYDRAQDYSAAKKARPGNYTDTMADPEGKMDSRGRPVTIEVDRQPVTPLVDINDYIPLALQNKHKLTNWIVLWPCSVLKYIFGEMFQRIVDFIIRHFGKFYDALAARHFKGLPQ